MKMPCPFLTRLPTQFVRNYGANLVKKYGEQCPVLTRVLSTVSAPATAGMIKEFAQYFSVVCTLLYQFD